MRSLRTMMIKVVMGKLPEAEDCWVLQGNHAKEGQAGHITEDPDQKHIQVFRLHPKSGKKPLEGSEDRHGQMLFILTGNTSSN